MAIFVGREIPRLEGAPVCGRRSNLVRSGQEFEPRLVPAQLLTIMGIGFARAACWS